MYVYLFELIAIGKRSAGDVDMMLGVFVHPEHQRLSGVVKRPAHLQQRRTGLLNCGIPATKVADLRRYALFSRKTLIFRS
jgi:hypothetical protein